MKNFAIILSFLAIGNWATAQTSPVKEDVQSRKAKMEMKRAEHMAELQRELNLSPEQVNKIQAAQNKQRELTKQQNETFRNQRKESFKKNREAIDAEMKTILTPQQYDKWQAKKKEKIAEKRAKMMSTSKDRKWGQTN